MNASPKDSASARKTPREAAWRQEMRAWYRTPLGEMLLAAEREALDMVLPDLFGYYLVQVGAGCDDYLLGSSLIRRQVLVDQPVATKAGAPAGPSLVVCGRADLLPLSSDTVDVVLLPHTLDFEDSAHEVLRETERVLVPEGHVVIVGFNPWSLWGLRRAVAWRPAGAPWTGSFRSPSRVRDWLALLGFDIILSRTLFFRPPARNVRVMRRLHWMDRAGTRGWPYLGGAYIIVAAKRVSTFTPIKPRWRPRRSLIGGGAIKPTATIGRTK